MKMFIFVVLSLFFARDLRAAPLYSIRVLNPSIANAAMASFGATQSRYIQGGVLLDVDRVDEAKPSCMVAGGKIGFAENDRFPINTVTTTLVDDEVLQLNLTMKTDAPAAFSIYCFTLAQSATIDLAREALYGVFEITTN